MAERRSAILPAELAGPRASPCRLDTDRGMGNITRRLGAAWCDAARCEWSKHAARAEEGQGESVTTVVKQDRSGGGDVQSIIQQVGPLSEADRAVLYRHYKPRLTARAARNGAADPEGAADLALVDGLQAMPRLRKRTERSFRAYLDRILYSYVSLDHRGTHPEPHELDDDDLPPLLDPTNEVVDQLWLRQLVDELPPDQRAVIVGRYYEDLPATVIGVRLGKKPNAVHQLQHRAIRRLRKAIALAVVAVLVIAGLVLRQLADGSQTVDSSPVESVPAPETDVERAPSSTAVPSPPPSRGGPDAVPDLGADSTPLIATDAETEVDEIGSAGRTSTSAGDIETSATTQEAADAAPPATVTTPPTTDATTTTVVSTTAPASTTSTVPTQTSIPLSPATPPNVCAPHQMSPTMSAYKLYNPGGAGSRADSFNPPASVRFLDADGQEIHRVDTSGPMVRSTSAGSHGWVGAGNATGTYPNHADAPKPTYWGVLVPYDQVASTVLVEVLDASSGAWLPSPGC